MRHSGTFHLRAFYFILSFPKMKNGWEKQKI